MSIARHPIRTAVTLVMAGSTLTACATAPASLAGMPPGQPVVSSGTPYSDALDCLTDLAVRSGRTPPHIAVDAIPDMTGKLDENTGNQVTRGAALMAMSALGKAHVPIVERYQIDVARTEYRLADNKLISDAPLSSGGASGERPYRPVMAGTMTGSDFYITGGITELNTNLHAASNKLTLGKQVPSVQVGAIGADSYMLSVAMDLRMVDTRTLDVVDTVSYQKQIIGRQVSGNLFSFFGNNVLSVSGSDGTEEPVHFAVRALIERGVYQMLAKAYDLNPDLCLNPSADPLYVPAASPAYAAPSAVVAQAPAVPLAPPPPMPRMIPPPPEPIVPDVQAFRSSTYESDGYATSIRQQMTQQQYLNWRSRQAAP